MTRTFQACVASAVPVSGHDASIGGESVASTASVMERSPDESLRTPTDESPMLSESPRSSASRTPSSYSSRSRSPASRSTTRFPSRASYSPSTVTRYGEWSNGPVDSGSREIVQSAPTTLGHNTSKKRPRPSEGKASTKRQRAQRMTEQVFEHSSGLLHRATLENDTRGGDLDDELRRQQHKREKYESRIRSLRRELEALDPEAAAAFERGELRAAGLTSDAPVAVGQPSRPMDAATESLLPPDFTQREATLRASSLENRALMSSFKSLLTQSRTTPSA